MLRTITVGIGTLLLAACSSPPPVATPTAIPAATATATSLSVASNPPASVSGYAGTSWPATAQSLAGRDGERFTYLCPADGVNWFIYGTDVYTSDSSVCTAAVHAGLITLESGGDVTIEMRPGRDSYESSTRNGIISAEYGPWEASFVFVGSAGTTFPPPTPVASTHATPTPAPTASPGPTRSPSPSGTPGSFESDLITPGQLTICTPFERALFAERDPSGKPFGVDVEIGLAIASQLGVEAVISEVAFENLIDSILAGACDVTIGGQFITQARLELIDMIPYRQGTQHVVVAAGNPLGIDALTDLCGRAVAIIEGTIHVDILNGTGEYAGRGVSDSCRQTGKPPVDVRGYATEMDAEAALASGETDAYIGNDFITVERPDAFQLSAALPPLRNGIGHRKGAAALDEALRSALRTIIGNGSYNAILEKYGVTQVRLTELP